MECRPSHLWILLQCGSRREVVGAAECCYLALAILLLPSASSQAQEHTGLKHWVQQVARGLACHHRLWQAHRFESGRCSWRYVKEQMPRERYRVDCCDENFPASFVRYWQCSWFEA